MADRLIVRLGSMGDVIHTLPTAAALAPVDWLIKPRWAPLLDGNPHVERALTEPPKRSHGEAFDFQGLIKSAWYARRSAPRVHGFDTPREWPARLFYTARVSRPGGHVVDHNLALAGRRPAIGMGASMARFWIPAGRPEGRLPAGRFILASPAAGWRSKEWPPEYWTELRAILPLPLVLNGPPGSGLDHESSLAGLIHATREAAAVIGLDSGPMHLAAALGKAGVAIFGPTDPVRNGPYGGTIRVLRAPSAATSYKRAVEIAASMREVTPAMAAQAIREML
jgi:heptosyltransferase-1